MAKRSSQVKGDRWGEGCKNLLCESGFIFSIFQTFFGGRTFIGGCTRFCFLGIGLATLLGLSGWYVF